MKMEDFPIEELVDDLVAASYDNSMCNLALTLGITTYSNGNSVVERIQINERTIAVIKEELDKRGIEVIIPQFVLGWA